MLSLRRAIETCLTRFALAERFMTICVSSWLIHSQALRKHLHQAKRRVPQVSRYASCVSEKMATLKAIRRRITSVRSTEQITRAMKLISAARLRRAQEALLSARPYDEALKRLADSVLLTAPELTAPAENAAGRILIVVVTSDRGLAGGYNVNLLRL